jgi:hypothetical protein
MARPHDSDQQHLIVAGAVFHSLAANSIHCDVNGANDYAPGGFYAEARQQPRSIATGNCGEILRRQRPSQILNLIERIIG